MFCIGHKSPFTSQNGFPLEGVGLGACVGIGSCFLSLCVLGSFGEFASTHPLHVISVNVIDASTALSHPLKVS